jgi:glycosyltransferase involved in cell wall biosynthesis
VRIAALIDTASLSGPGRQLAKLVPVLGAQGVDVCIVAIQRYGRPISPYIEYLRAEGVEHSVVIERYAFDLRLVQEVHREFDRLKPDIVQTHGYKPTAIAALLRAMGARWKWLGFWHGVTAEDRKVRMYHWLDERLIRRSDQIAVVSREQERIFQHGRTPVRVIANAVIPHAVDQQSSLPSLEDVTKPLLAVIGRLSPEKGVDVFLDAAALLHRRSVPFSAVIVGDGPERSRLEALNRTLGLEGHVRFLGAHKGLAALYEQSDVVVIPSRSEGLPNVLLEALGHDRPVVATSVGAIPDVVRSELVGIVIPPESATALADAIPLALALRHDDRAVVARREALLPYSLISRARVHYELYGSLLSRGTV